MKKSTIKYVAEFLAEWIEGEGGDELVRNEMVNARDEMFAELNKGAEKAAANRALYDAAKDVVLANLSETPVTVAELYEQVKDELPNGFSRSKVQYGMLHYWNDEVVKYDSSPATYACKA